MSDTVYTYPYSQAHYPSMPVVEIKLSVPGHPKKEAELMALVDSGSDGTLIPIDILTEIGARYVDQVRIRSIFDDTQLVDRYLVSLRLGSHLMRAVRVVAVDANEESILGRNVLNQLSITLNGFASMTEIPA